MTGTERLAAAVDRLKNETFPALAARVQVLLEKIARTADEGLTGPQVVALETELEQLAALFEGVAIEPDELPPLEPPVEMPGPFIPGQEEPGPLEAQFLSATGFRGISPGQIQDHANRKQAAFHAAQKQRPGESTDQFNARLKREQETQAARNTAGVAPGTEAQRRTSTQGTANETAQERKARLESEQQQSGRPAVDETDAQRRQREADEAASRTPLRSGQIDPRTGKRVP